MDYSPQGWEKEKPAPAEKKPIARRSDTIEKISKMSGPDREKGEKRDFQDFQDFRRRRGAERTAAGGERIKNRRQGEGIGSMDYSPQGWEKEKPARWERKGMDLWITPEAGDYSPLREILEIMEIRTGSMDYSPQGWEKEKPAPAERTPPAGRNSRGRP